MNASPVGPMQRQEWIDALADVASRVTTIEATTRNVAQQIARVERITEGHTANFLILDKDLVAYKDYIEKSLRHNPDSVRNTIIRLNENIEIHANNNAEVIALRLSNDSVVESKIEDIERTLSEMLHQLPTGAAGQPPHFPIHTSVPDPW